ncbi:MAG: hypothetical protein B6D41_16685 [Chloroflexi bacterium UTCFX4]|nr:MAG: hypothetical protein B6D41_16685 [Chloroflexi bacterium UTCFX4]
MTPCASGKLFGARKVSLKTSAGVGGYATGVMVGGGRRVGVRVGRSCARSRGGVYKFNARMAKQAARNPAARIPNHRAAR